MSYTKESDGERSIRVTLDKLDINYEQEKKINKLKYDNKEYRRADFYLPDYNIYIEFFGGWDNPDPEKAKKEHKRYNHKRIVYKKNNIECIYLYPKQLKCIEYVLKQELKKYESKIDKKKRIINTYIKNTNQEKSNYPLMFIIIGIIMIFVPLPAFRIFSIIFIIIGIIKLRKRHSTISG